VHHSNRWRVICPQCQTHDFDLLAASKKRFPPTRFAMLQSILIFAFTSWINGYFDYKQGVALRKAQNKPLFHDFTDRMHQLS